MRAIINPTFGPVPRWMRSRAFRWVVLPIAFGMELGLAVLEPRTSILGLIVHLLPSVVRVGAILALFLGAVFGFVMFTYLTIWEHRYERAKPRVHPLLRSS